MNSDESLSFTPKYDASGLIGAIVVDDSDGAVLMFAHMNADALAATQKTGLVHFWSRSRGKLWMKGESSGETFKVISIRVDCDQDCLLVHARPQAKGNACHTGRRSCFYRMLDDDELAFD
jgi:phosphoribosyl-AMP cyclohydrolase